MTRSSWLSICRILGGVLMWQVAGACVGAPEGEEVAGLEQQLTPPTLAGWWGWGEVQGGMLANTAVSATSHDQRIYLFTRKASDNRAYVTSAFNGRGFEGWNAVGGVGAAPIQGAPAAATLGNAIYMFARQADNNIYMTRSNRPLDRKPLAAGPDNATFTLGAAWTPWGAIQGGAAMAASPPSAVGMRNHLFAFIRRADGTLWYNAAKHNNGFAGWQQYCSNGVGCGTTDVTPVGATLSTALYLFSKGIGDQKIYIKSTRLTQDIDSPLSPAFSNWDEVQHQSSATPFTTTTPLGAAGFGDYLFVARRRPSDGVVEWNAAKDGEAFNTWQALPSNVTTPYAPSVAVLNNRIYFFAVQMDGRVFVTSATFTSAGGSVAPFKPTVAIAPPPVSAPREFFPVNAAVVRGPSDSTRVLLYGGHSEIAKGTEGVSFYGEASWTWDPTSGGFSQPQVFPEDLDANNHHTDPFCNHMVQLPDGKLLAMGGELSGPDGHQHQIMAAAGARGAFVFDPSTSVWSLKTKMNCPRWYPTPVALQDGNVFVASGFDDTNADGNGRDTPVGQSERYSVSGNSWALLANVKPLQTYPGLHMIPNGPLAGRILYTGTRWGSDMAAFQPWNPSSSVSFPNQDSAVPTGYYNESTGAWTTLSITPGNRTEGMSVLLPFSSTSTSEVMVFGGGQLGPDANPRSVMSLALGTGTPAWINRTSMHYRRSNVNAVVLPDGKIAILGGQQCEKRDVNSCPVLQIELYDPAANTSVRDAWLAKPRPYHSEAVLLPDGRVFVVGGEDMSQGTRDDQNNKSYEIYSPPYMSKSNRPVINNYPATINYTQSINLSVQTTRAISRIVLVRPMTVTHHTSPEQRVMNVTINAGTGTPSGSGIALPLAAAGQLTRARLSPGNYMLFVVNDEGTPSVAKWVRLM